MLKHFAATIISFFLFERALASNCHPVQGSASTTKDSRMVSPQSQFDSLIICIAKAGITNIQELEKNFNTKFDADSEDSRGGPSMLRSTSLSSDLGITKIRYFPQFEIIDNPSMENLTAASLSISFAQSSRISPKNITDKYEDPIYLLPPSYNSLGYFRLGDIDVFLSYASDTEPVEAIDRSGPAVTEVVFSWNRDHTKPAFPVLLDRNKMK
jgi:hypothetical protein